MAIYRAFLLAGTVAVEAALLSLAAWQYHRYQQRLEDQTDHDAAPQVQVIGKPVSYAFLTNQPNPRGEGVGRRLLSVFETAQGHMIADLGWQPNPPVPTAAPDFSPYQLPLIELTGIEQTLPRRRGWLQGPVITTHPQLLAFLEPIALTSATVPSKYIAATVLSPSLPGITPAPAAVRSPYTHLSYALQWLGMAMLFPLLCWNANRRSRTSRSRR